MLWVVDLTLALSIKPVGSQHLDTVMIKCGIQICRFAAGLGRVRVGIILI